MCVCDAGECDEFDIALTEVLDAWMHDRSDDRCEGQVVREFLCANPDLVAAVLTGRHTEQHRSFLAVPVGV